MTKKLSEADRKLLAKRIWGRCYMRLQRELNRKPTKDEMEDCMKEELYKERLGLVEKKKKGRKSSEEDFFTTMGERETPQISQSEEEISDEEMRRFLRRRQAKEDLEDLATLGRLNEGLAQWGNDEEIPSREEQMKELSREINENLNEQSWKNICPVCKSSVCRCGEDE